VASQGVPSGLLRQPGALESQLEQPISDQIAGRNRYRKPTVAVEADGKTVEPVTSEDSPGVAVKRSRATEASHASILGLADEKPRNGQLLSVRINGNLVFAGRIHSAQLDDAGILTVSGYDDTRRLLRTPFSGSYNAESVGQVVRDVASNAAVGVHRIQRKFLALSQIEIEGEEIEPGYRRIVDETGTDAQSGEQTTASGSPGTDEPGDTDRNYLTVTHDFKNANSAQILDDLAGATDALWWVSPRNGIIFTDSPDITTHGINGITSSNAGEQALPYQKVVVMGAAKKKPEGDRRRARRSKNRVRGVAGDKSAPQARTYPVTKQTIKTQQQAQNMARAVWKEYRRQRKTGVLRLAGRAAVFPDDVVSLPPYYGNEEYLVKSIRHTIDSSEAFTSEIMCGGSV
jgi:phage protein D